MLRSGPPWQRRLRLDAALGAGGGALAVLVGGVVGLLDDQPAAAIGVSACGAATVGWAIYRQLQSTPTAVPPNTEPAARPVNAPAWNIPPPVRGFIGRDGDLAALGEGLADHGPVGMVAVTGLGGMGKTQLALWYASIQREHRHVSVGWLLNASSRGYLLDGLARLSATLALPESSSVEVAAARALGEIVRRPGWLLVYDDAKDQATLDGLLPLSGPGQVIITSRYADWRGSVALMPVDELDYETGADFLQARARDGDRAAALDLAHRLGGLPLALEQAAAYCRNGGIRLRDYLNRFEVAPATLLSTGHPYGLRPVARTWLVNLAAVRRSDRAAVELLSFLAFVAPVALPRDVLLRSLPTALPRRLRRAVREDRSFDAVVALLTDLSLLVAQPDGLYVHALVQEVMRERIAWRERRLPWGWTRRRWIGSLLRILAEEFPAEGHTVDQWERCAELRPHAEAALSLSDQLGPWPPAAASLAHLLAHYLRDRGEYADACNLLESATTAAVRELGRYDNRTVTYMMCLGWALQKTGDLGRARALYERMLDGVVIIDNGRVTFTTPAEHDDRARLTCMNNLAHTLSEQGEFGLAGDINKRVLAGRRRILGDDDPETMRSWNGLAVVLGRQGHYIRARRILENVLPYQRRELGDDHPDTLNVINSLATVLHDQGDLNGARALQEEELDRRRRVLGDDHPTTLIAMNHLADTLAELGAGGRADRLRHECDKRAQK
ncbi:tetratricopeptide repeat protein [Actinoplanes sp. NPDC049265]|uniref:tetratricopeptide repeat protein n=1 Tax=Actinoplanes sp. NPDC049265 TaxID=3363902 RepID=UPI003720701B